MSSGIRRPRLSLSIKNRDDRQSVRRCSRRRRVGPHPREICKHSGGVPSGDWSSPRRGQSGTPMTGRTLSSGVYGGNCGATRVHMFLFLPTYQANRSPAPKWVLSYHCEANFPERPSAEQRARPTALRPRDGYNHDIIGGPRPLRMVANSPLVCSHSGRKAS